MIYGVYANAALVHWPPSKIFGDEIRVSTTLATHQKILTFNLTRHRRLLDHLLRRTAFLALSPILIVEK